MRNSILSASICLILVASAAHARAKSGVVPEGALLPDVWQPGAAVKEAPPVAILPQDECSPIAYDAYAYAVCEDRLARIARLRASVEARRKMFEAVPGTPE